MKINLFFVLILASFNVSAASIETFVSIIPQQYFVERIGGELVHVNVMVKPGQSPETFEPSPKLMSAYSKADIYFTIGMPFEKVWINRVASLNPEISIISTQPDEADRMLADHTHHHEDQHQEEPAHEEHHEDGHEDNLREDNMSWDPHTWLSPVMAIKQAKIITAELSRISPENKSLFVLNYNKLEKELNEFDENLHKRFQQAEKRNFITFHPAFSYFARQYGLTQLSIEMDGKEPTAKQIAAIVERVKDRNVSFILIEKQFNHVISRTIANSIGAELMAIDPLAYDYINNLHDIADKIDKALF